MMEEFICGRDFRHNCGLVALFVLRFFKQASVLMLILCASVILTGCGKHSATLSFGNVKIFAPVPRGFNPVSAVAPPFMAYMKTREPPLSVLIEYYITDADLKDVLAGHSKSRGQTLGIRVTQDALFQDYDENSFLADASEIRVDSERDAAQAKAIQNGQIAIGLVRPIPGLPKNATPLGMFFDQPDGIGTFISQEFHTPNGIVRRVTAGIRLRVRHRALDINCSSVVTSDADSLEIRRICSDWAVSILRANADAQN